MEDYNIPDEDGGITPQYPLGKSDHINLPDTAGASANSEIENLLIKVQQLVKSLEDAYWEAVTQGDEERALRLYESIQVRPRLLIDDLELYDERGRVERETAFITRAKSWIREVERLL